MLRPETEHSGWSNYATFLVALWIDNHERIQEQVLRMFDDGEVCADDLKLWVKSRMPEANHNLALRHPRDVPPGVVFLVADLANAALERVDWSELLEHFHNKHQEITAHASNGAENRTA